MKSIHRLVAIVVVVFTTSVEGKTLPSASENARKLDTTWTKGPDPTKQPTRRPTKRPTKRPTPHPTPGPTIQAPFDSSVPTVTPPPKCGTLVKGDGSGLLLGPYDETIPWTKDRFGGNTEKNNWAYEHGYWPSYLYIFRVTKLCQYQYRMPDNNKEYVTVPGVNEWFDQAAQNFKRIDNNAYKVSDADIGFSGFTIPQKSDIIKTNIAGCPENYCIKVGGPAIVRLGNSNNGSNNVFQDPPELVYAFSSHSAWNDFYNILKRTMDSSQKDHIYLTNHFLRCGQESFCVDELNPWDSVDVQATCYVDETCGERVFKVAYVDDYPNSQKASWASTGTMEVMEWFNECALAMFGCTETSDSDRSKFKGTRWFNSRYFGYPLEFTYDVWNNDTFVYGLGGKKYNGFPSSSTDSVPQVAWTCPTADHRNEFRTFGQYVKEAEFMRDSGLGTSVPSVPCPPIVPQEPVHPNVTNSGPGCDDMPNHVYCFETGQSTCYAVETQADCENVLFFRVNGTSTQAYGYYDFPNWHDDCLEGLGCVKPSYWASINGNITYRGRPNPYPYYSNGWRYRMTNRKPYGEDTLNGKHKSIWYSCPTWQSAYAARNFTDGAGDRHWKFGNTYSYGDLYRRRKCSESPSSVPTENPTISAAPSEVPSFAPSLCAETYLTSESLNIALVIDLSFSTYEKSFSATDPVGDLNGDGKANTILDAQVAAIEELLINIQKSPNLDNNNCEIELISFETDAVSHGVWQPLSTSNDAFNPELMQYVKDELWAPTSPQDVYETNNGFTNFDAALDRSVEYFNNTATAGRTNLLVFLSDGEPNVRGDGDNEGYCSPTATFWNNDPPTTILQCDDLNLTPGQPHQFCRGNDPTCVPSEPYQDCVRGPNRCQNADAATDYDSEINALVELNVERLSIGVGNESRVEWGSGLWVIDNNPAKYLGVLPLQALTLDELSEYLSNLCILNTDPPTASPSSPPSGAPTVSAAPSSLPSVVPSPFPSVSFAPTPSATLSMLPSDIPSESMAPSESLAPTKQCPEVGEGTNTGPFGVMRFCVRSSYGYRYGVANSYQEVNFIESLITIRYNFEAGFCVLDFNVDPKERVETTVQGDGFGLEAWLCDTSVTQTRFNPERTLPAPIASTYLAESSDPSNATYFNQGSLITVCVAPDDEAYIDNMRMSSIISFNWKRNDLNTTAGLLPLDQRMGVPTQLFQEAIIDSAPSYNGLTSYISTECHDSEFCHFSSVLFADFYVSRGIAYGDGTARLKFPGAIGRRERRLGETEDPTSRRLQEEEEDSESSFDVAVLVDIIGNGPNGLKTAGCGRPDLTTTLIVPLIFSSIAFLTWCSPL